MEFDPTDPEQVARKAIELQRYADSMGVDCNTLRMQQAFYQHDKKKFGSFKHLIGMSAYIPSMYGRHQRVLHQIKETIDTKAGSEVDS